MKRPRGAFLAALLSFFAGAGAMWAQQSATRREPQFENEQVRVWKSVIMPNQQLTIHRHEHARVLIALTRGELKVVDPYGRTLNTYRWDSGKAYWLDADPLGQLHADVNDTSHPIEVIVVELLKDR